jgi:hypothetical protein
MSGALGPGVVQTSMIAPNAITEALLSAALDRQAVPHGTDVIEVEPDRWRFKSSEVALVTAIDGTGWEQFPRALTPTLRGINQSGTAIALRKSAPAHSRAPLQCGGFRTDLDRLDQLQGLFRQRHNLCHLSDDRHHGGRLLCLRLYRRHHGRRPDLQHRRSGGMDRLGMGQTGLPRIDRRALG